MHTRSVLRRNHSGWSRRMFKGVDCMQKRRWLDRDLRRSSSSFLLPLWNKTVRRETQNLTIY